MEKDLRGVISELPVRGVAETLNYYRDVLGYKIVGQHGGVFGAVLKGVENFYFSKADGSITPGRTPMFPRLG